MDMSEEEHLRQQKELRRRRREAARRKRRRQRLNRIICTAAVLVLVIVIGFAIFGGRGSSSGDAAEDDVSSDAAAAESGDGRADAESADAADTASEAKKSEPVTITMSFTGDCTLGTDENFNYSTSLNAYYESYGADYFFEGVRDIFEADDITVVNMEGTLTEETAREDKTYAFKGDPEYVQILSGSSVEAANLANNHSHDYGTQSYEDTINTLEDNSISHFGYDDIAYFEINGVTVGLVGIYELARGWVFRSR